MTIPVISLFCGCGGFDYGFKKAGFEVSLALDIDPIVIQSYNYNHGEGIANQADLSITTGQEIIEMLRVKQVSSPPKGVIGGSPCQSFSAGNVHFKEDDVKHTLPRKYAEILKVLNAEFELDFFVFENVRGITYRNHKASFSEFVGLFEEAGFSLFYGLLDAVNFGVPQYRPRVFIVGINREKYKDQLFSFPEPSTNSYLSVDQVIANLPNPTFYTRNLKPENIGFHPNHWTMQPRSAKFSNGFLKEGQNKGRSFRVLSWSKPSWTVAYGNREIHVHPSGTRRLSVYESMRIQGLPHSYRLFGTLTKQIHQVSDTIPPQVGFALGQAIASFFRDECETILSIDEQETSSVV